MKTAKYLGVLLSCLFIIACGSENTSFSLLSDNDSFSVDGGENVLSNAKVDILFVVDNSGSMGTSQANLANNFNSFINEFITKGWDFRIAVTVTDAYKDQFFDDGSANFKNASGYSVLDLNTPNLTQAFIDNITVGTGGSGDERAHSSMRQALDDPDNAGFLRPDSFLAVIIISDEDDFSHDGSFLLNNYSDPSLHPYTDYTTYLDNLTGTSGASARYNVSTISILDSACYDALTVSWPGRKISVRNLELVNATGGVAGSLCDPFPQILDELAENIGSEATKFFLSRLPQPETITVFINGVLIPNDANNGWTYDAAENSVTFHGSSKPQQGSNVVVNFIPQGLGG